jgi:transposase
LAERTRLVSHLTRLKNREQSVLHANLLPRYEGKLFTKGGREWLEEAPLPADQKRVVSWHLSKHDRLVADLALVDQELAKEALGDPRIRRLMAIGGVNAIVAAGVLAAIRDITRFSSPEKSVRYFGLNPSVRQSADRTAFHGC